MAEGALSCDNFELLYAFILIVYASSREFADAA